MTTKRIATASPLGAWTDPENNVIVASYCRMLALEMAGEKYNKAAARREGLAAMAATRDDQKQRSPGSWEMKCCNISAVMRAARMPYINGYKPLGHGQARALAAAIVPHALAHGHDDAAIARLEALTKAKP